MAFSLDPKPTFNLAVDIPVPGDGFASVKFTFKYRTRKEFLNLLEELKGKTDEELLMMIAVGWGVDAPFNEENCKKLSDNYMGAVGAVFEAYSNELTKVREKN